MSLPISPIQPPKIQPPLRQRGTRRACTGAIVLGTYTKHRFPGSSTFQHYCRRLQAAFPPCKRARRTSFVRALAELCSTIETRSNIFDKYPRAHGKLVNLLGDLAAKRTEWIRLLDTWEPDLSGTGKEQYANLLEHLFIKYPPPNFFKGSMQGRDGFSSREYAWYLHLGSGQSLRTAPDLRAQLSKREAHLVLQAPTELDIHEALLWGKITALGADSELTAELMRTYSARQFVWTSSSRWGDERPELKPWFAPLVRLITRTPDADRDQVGPLIDFLDNRLRRFSGGLRPDLKNQTFQSLLRLMEEWHAELNREHERRLFHQEITLKNNGNWPADRGIRPLHVIAKPGDGICMWQIVELRCQDALNREGRAMKHCVASYAARCASGSSSIWSLRTVSPKGMRSIATIEVQKSNGRRIIAQARGISNARPDATAMELIDRWAERSSIETL